MSVGPRSAIARALDPEGALWADPAMANFLLAAVVDHLAAANWQRSGGKGSRPKPVPRPGVGPQVTNIQMDRFNSPAAFDEWWAAN